MEQQKQAEVADEVVKECAGTNLINVGGNTVTQSTESLPDNQKNLIRWLYNIARENRWSWSELEDKSGIDKTTIYRVFHNRYINPKTKEPIALDGVCQRIAKFKKQAEPLLSFRDTVFVETSVWERTNWLCERSLKRHKMGFVYGESQSGKTTCLLEHKRRNNHGQTTYVEVPPAAGVQLMTKYIARALHVSTSTCFENLIGDVIGALDESRLLIIDEIHRVFTTYQKTSVMRCLDVLRHIHDQTRCGMVLSGTNVFRDRLKEGEFFQYLKQLKRRGIYEIQLPGTPIRKDLDLIARQYGLAKATDEAEEIMLSIADRDGLGVFFTRLDDAAELAKNKGETLSWSHFIKACNIVERMRQELD